MTKYDQSAGLDDKLAFLFSNMSVFVQWHNFCPSESDILKNNFKTF